MQKQRNQLLPFANPIPCDETKRFEQTHTATFQYRSIGDFLIQKNVCLFSMQNMFIQKSGFLLEFPSIFHEYN